MSKAENYIREQTKRCSEGIRPFEDWLTPDQARKAIEIAREEVIEWMKNHWREYVNVDMDGVVCFGHWELDLKQAMKDG